MYIVYIMRSRKYSRRRTSRRTARRKVSRRTARRRTARHRVNRKRYSNKMRGGTEPENVSQLEVNQLYELITRGAYSTREHETPGPIVRVLPNDQHHSDVNPLNTPEEQPGEKEYTCQIVKYGKGVVEGGVCLGRVDDKIIIKERMGGTRHSPVSPNINAYPFKARVQQPEGRGDFKIYIRAIHRLANVLNEIPDPKTRLVVGQKYRLTCMENGSVSPPKVLRVVSEDPWNDSYVLDDENTYLDKITLTKRPKRFRLSVSGQPSIEEYPFKCKYSYLETQPDTNVYVSVYGPIE